MKIMGLRFGCSNRNGQDAGSLDGYGVILILQDAFNSEKFLAVDAVATIPFALESRRQRAGKPGRAFHLPQRSSQRVQRQPGVLRPIKPVLNLPIFFNS